LSQIVADLVSCQNQIDSFFVNQHITLLLKKSNIAKKFGVSPVVVMRFIFSLVFTGKNLFRYLQATESDAQIGKDTVYRFLNSTTANWRKFLHLLSGAVIREQILPLTADSTPKVFIVDDSLYNRNRSKKVELLSRVHDHNEKRFYCGFRLLTLGWSDGATCLPVSFSLLSSAKEKNRLFPMRADIDKRTNGFKRRCESVRKSTQVLVELIAQAKAAGIAADYLLFDSWFSFPATIIRLLEEKVQVICMLKAMKTTYDYQGTKLTLNELYKGLRKRAGRAKILASCVVTLGEATDGSKIMAKIVFVRNRSSRNWLALLSTDVNLADEEIIKLYKRRWDIEVFFKMTKSYLNLAKEFQGRSYDSLVAHTTIVFTRYIMLATGQRMTKDPRTLGNLFHAGCDELRQVSFAEALTMLLGLLQQVAQEIPAILAAWVQQLLDSFIAGFPALLRRMLLIPAWNY
jgi:DDE superfamily endonuclease